MALAAATSLRADSSVPVAGLAAASIAAPCILGSTAAQQQAGSSPEVLLCTVGRTSSQNGIQLSSAPAVTQPNGVPCHLSATVAAVQMHCVPGRAHTRQVAQHACHGSSSSQMASRSQTANIARIEDLAGDGYVVHPASVDSSLHLGAVIREEDNAPSRVPVGLGAYSAQKPGDIPSVCVNL